MESLEIARQLFWDYACNHFYMAHDGVDAEYKQYQISSEQEHAWRVEYIRYWTDQLSGEFLLPLQRLTDAVAYECLPDLIRLSPTDDYFAYRLADTLWELAGFWTADHAVRDEARETALRLWRGLTYRLLKINPEYRKILEDTDGVSIRETAEVELRAMAARKIETAESQMRNYPDTI
jgi:hypothetical protein